MLNNLLASWIFLSLAVLFPTALPAQDIHWPSFSQYTVTCPHTEPLLERLQSSKEGSSFDVLRGAFAPHVIRNDRTEPVIFEATITGDAPTVTLEIDGLELSMYDDGTHGDAAAGDNTYTIILSVEQIISRLSESDVFRPFVGFVNLRDGDTIVLRFSVFAEIWTPSMPLVPVTQLSPSVQSSPHLFNIKDEVEATGIGFDPQSLSQEFYRWFADDYDFIHFLLVPGFRANRHHVSIRNATQGLGLSDFDHSSAFGSAGRLIGYNVFPIPFFFDGANTGFIHEMGHQWINFLHGTPLASGIPHWPFSSVASGVMGFSIPGSGAGGRFSKRIDPEGDGYRVTSDAGLQFPLFNDMELYLMGLLSQDEVSPLLLFKDQSQFPADGFYPASAFTEISIEDIVSVVGARTPGAERAQRHFKVATIVVSDELLSPEEMAFYDYFVQRAEGQSPVSVTEGFLKGLGKPFYVATGERATLELKLEAASTAVEEIEGEFPDGFWLGQNYPNPFNPRTSITFDLAQPSPVSLTAYDVLGREIAVIASGFYPAGSFKVTWDATGYPSGVYIYRLEGGSFVEARRMIVQK